jgi:ABC-type phosphate transport system substrate-binding protein
MNLRHSLALGMAALCAAATLPGAEVLSGAGATFPFPLYQKWFASYETKF